MQRTLHHTCGEKGDCTARAAEPRARSPAAGTASGTVILAVLLLSRESWDGSSLGLCCTCSSSPFDGASRDFGSQELLISNLGCSKLCVKIAVVRSTIASIVFCCCVSLCLHLCVSQVEYMKNNSIVSPGPRTRKNTSTLTSLLTASQRGHSVTSK